ncbi:MAG TPA: hypothetical protein VIQ30_01540, partial [Pseudonocardia sp.]
GNVDGTLAWGEQGSGGAASLVSLRNGGRMSAPVPTSTATSWTFEFVVRYDAGTGTAASFPMTLWAGGQWEWSFAFTPAGQIQMAGGTTDGTALLSLSGPFQAWDGQLHLIRLDVEQDGTGSDHFLWVDGELAASGTWASFLAPVPDQILPNSYLDSGDLAPSIGHLALFAPHANYFDTTRAAAAQAWVRERPVDRVERLCTEAGIAFTAPPVDGGYQPLMGPQPAATLAELIEQCVKVDGGILYEPRDSLGLAYRPLRSLYNQDPALTVDWQAKQVAPPFDPVIDDLNIRNDITVKRTGGSSARAVRTTGPLAAVPAEDGGAGVYATEVELNLPDDSRLPDIAGWLLHIGAPE